MALKQQLQQRQVQRLVLAPALQQAIKLLPLTNLELIEIIDAELSQNPMLELEEDSMDSKTDKESSADKEPSELQREKAIEDELSSGVDSANRDEDSDINAYFQEYFDDRMRSSFIEKKEALNLENFIAKRTTLWDHLDWQVNLSFSDEEDREIAKYIIGNINEDGYLTMTEEEIAEFLKVPLQKVNAIRKKIMNFDPVGVGSLELKEALLIQMDYLGIDDAVTREIISKHLQLLEKSDYLQLTKVMGLSMDEVKTHIDVIKSLDPTPGRKYSEEKTYYVIPDIIVKKEDDELKVTLNNEGLPRLRINNYYRTLLAKSLIDNPEASEFLKDKMKKAFWFLRSLDQRNQTIDRVAKYIVEKQKDFIEKGLEYIKPLTLIELAQEIGVHESTVGRVVANKYMMTSRGVFPLKYFFHKSLSGNYGEEISSLRVKERIKKLVENELKENPLSDIEIEDVLAKENFNIARRTVAKYRKQLDIPPSHIRKRKYWMEESS
ncbi:MAG: RNA polymerase factor sigma-54 [Candidatus Aminicenantes bacterium]|nr:RNA polymerase factor sigma-54 [Candidatus Aminicenantes bacterium]